MFHALAIIFYLTPPLPTGLVNSSSGKLGIKMGIINDDELVKNQKYILSLEGHKR
jgi:hypothetical protein